MSKQHEKASNGGWGTTASVVMAAAMVGFAAMWALFVTSPPEGLVPAYGMAVSLVAGGYLLFVVYSYANVGIAR